MTSTNIYNYNVFSRTFGLFMEAALTRYCFVYLLRLILFVEFYTFENTFLRKYECNFNLAMSKKEISTGIGLIWFNPKFMDRVDDFRFTYYAIKIIDKNLLKKVPVPLRLITLMKKYEKIHNLKGD